MTLAECTEAVCNYWEELQTDQQQTILDQLCNVTTIADDLRRVRADTQYEREHGRVTRTKALREIDTLVAICDGIWGEDGP